MANTFFGQEGDTQDRAPHGHQQERRSRVRTYVRKVEEALASGDKAAAEAAFLVAQPELMRAAGKGVMHRNTDSTPKFSPPVAVA